ncbi:HNH endonuclease signature motif containing protein [Galactobacter valiniphilus]|uniref:HNH endonuclease signature motif containing protein n=1 Tax=Galactobacter valiniphilus TaxID=2676122 RepID=UPI00373696C5
MFCNDSLQLLIEDERGNPLKLGREHRLFSPHQRRVLLARDRTCRAPGCGLPGGWCEAHHVTPWSRGGPSDVDQGILLCSFHHHEVHEGRLSIEASPPGSDGHAPWRVVSPIPGWIR